MTLLKSQLYDILMVNNILGETMHAKQFTTYKYIKTQAMLLITYFDNGKPSSVYYHDLVENTGNAIL